MTSNFPTKPAQVFPPLSHYRCKAVVDWIDIRLTVAKPTNFMTVQAALRRIMQSERNLYVTGLDEQPGRAATVFVIRFQDPASFPYLRDCFEKLAEHFDITTPPDVVEIEVAVDFYSKSHSRDELLLMTTRLMREITASGDNPRQYVQTKKKEDYETRFLERGDESVNPLNTLYIGHRDTALIKWKIYLKETDNNQLPIQDPSEHRARMEITLKEIELADYVTTLTSLSDMKFERLSRKFKCRYFVPPAVDESGSPLQRVLANRNAKLLLKESQAGQCALWKAKRRKYTQLSQTDVELNSMVRESLRGLSKRFNTGKRGRKQGKCASFPSEALSSLITKNTVVTSPSSSSRPVASV